MISLFEQIKSFFNYHYDANLGIVLGKKRFGKIIRDNSPDHVIVVGPCASGIGSSIVIPSLFSWTHSVLVTDINGQNWDVTSGFRKKHLKNKVLKFDPIALTGSVKYNPLNEVRLKTSNEIRDVQNLVDMLMDPPDYPELQHGGFWHRTARTFLVGIILHLLYLSDKANNSRPSLTDIVTFLSNPSRDFEDIFDEMMNAEHADPIIFQEIYQKSRFDEEDHQLLNPGVHPIVAQIGKAMLNKSESECSGVLSTAVSYLGLYRDPIIAENTSSSEFKIVDLMDYEQPVSLYLVIRPNDIKRVVPLFRILLSQVIYQLMDLSDQHNYQLLLLLDQFLLLGRLEGLETTLPFMRNKGIKSLLTVHSIDQLNKVYGEGNNILDSCHIRILFSQSIVHSVFGGIKPKDLYSLPYNKEILSFVGYPPITLQKHFYYRDKKFREYCLAAPLYSDYIPCELACELELMELISKGG